jgi:hypothetical protein
MFFPFQNFAWVFVGLLIVSVLLIAILALCGLFLSPFWEKCPWLQKSRVPNVDTDAEVESVFSKNEDSCSRPLPLVLPLDPTPNLCLSWFCRIFTAKKTVVSGPPHRSKSRLTQHPPGRLEFQLDKDLIGNLGRVENSSHPN